MPGPRPKPTRLKELAGNPGKRKLNKFEPAFSGAPKCPAWITKEAKREWKRIAYELAHLDMLRSVDSAALASYCQSYARWMTAERIVDAEGQTVNEPLVNKSGEVVGHRIKRHPATAIAKDERAAMHKAASMFGFDPSSRSRMTTGDAPTSDPFEDFMKGMGAAESTHDEADIPS